MVAIASIFLSAVLLAAMACRDLVKRHQRVYHASIWAGALVLSVLVWNLPRYLKSVPFDFP